MGTRQGMLIGLLIGGSYAAGVGSVVIAAVQAVTFLAARCHSLTMRVGRVWVAAGH